MATGPGVIVRRAESNDRDQVYPLAKELATSFVPSQTCFGESFSGLISDPNALVLVASDQRSGQLVGYLLGFRHGTFFADGPVGWIEEIYTRSDRRRAGIGGALMQAFENWAWESNARLVALATRRSRAFYEAIGYEDSAVYYRKLTRANDDSPTRREEAVSHSPSGGRSRSRETGPHLRQ